ncbi:RDD family protein [Chitiniphilus purpureus]|uniref:RDD family protein n=1 Tax=Chitiniphilus purpureus TaxID=2981137 RepID=A0ABY6DP43_9NEIS|nr:RDD family protein [Chitiniphilus sp. CD1]UXY16126.1 RDD family protein [Chitiniphilus sp. CD1]
MSAVRPPLAGWWRRLCALLYEGMLVVPVVLLAAVAAVAVQAVLQGLMGLPLTGQFDHPFAHALNFVWLMLALFGYFAFCWRHGGQTLAMKTWRIRLAGADGSVPGWRPLLLRFILAALCYVPLAPLWFAARHDARWIPWAWLALAWFLAPFVWAWFDRDRQLLYDRFAGTRQLYAPTRKGGGAKDEADGEQHRPVV